MKFLKIWLRINKKRENMLLLERNQSIFNKYTNENKNIQNAHRRELRRRRCVLPTQPYFKKVRGMF